MMKILKGSIAVLNVSIRYITNNSKKKIDPRNYSVANNARTFRNPYYYYAKN